MFIVSLWGFQGVELIVRNEFLILLKVLPDYYSYIQLNCAQKKKTTVHQLIAYGVKISNIILVYRLRFIWKK